MDKATDFVKNLSSISGQTSLVFLLLSFALIFTIHTTNSLRVWHQQIPLINFSLNWGDALLYLSIIYVFLFLVLQCNDWRRIYLLRCQYPITNIEKTFFAIDVKGNVFLLDMSRKEIRWIENWQTLSDLLLNGYLIVLFSNGERARHWSNFTSGKIETEARKKLKGKLKGRNYKFGKGIRTRGIPGT